MYYNADLIDITKGKWELSTGFVNDCAFVVIADNIDNMHLILKNMMEQPNGGLDWSHSHNSPFELSKLVVMDFTRTPNDIASTPLSIDKTSEDGTITHHNITTTMNYKYLGVVFNPKLNWRAHISKVVARATKWSQQIHRLAKLTGSISPGKVRQLYNMVAVPVFTYASDIWYIPPFKFTHKRNSLSSVSATKPF